MCGIVSIFHYNNQTVDRDELCLIRDYMTPRGPDGYGEWYSPDHRIGMGHRCLAIIDLYFDRLSNHRRQGRSR